MTQEFAVVITDDQTPRIDSRLVATSLGIEHESLVRTLTAYAREFEELGVIRFEIGVKSGPQRGKLPQYVMLNEDQTIFAATLSRNTRQVVDFKLQLTKAFSWARRQLQEQERQQASARTLKEQLRDRLLVNVQNIPDGCFTVGSVALRHFTVLMDILNGLDVAAMPEQSIAQHFARYAKEVLYISDEHRSRYTHVLANGRVVQAWAYDLRYLTIFEKWLWGVYFPRHFPTYERYRARRIGLPAPKTKQPLLAQTQHSQIIQQSFAWK